ncbi:unnamed protein product [Malus baccata var. baccata]
MASSSNFNMLNLINIQKLNGTNFKAWKHKVEMHLGMLEFDIAFKLPQPSTFTNDSTSLQRDRFAKSERAKQMSLLIMKNAMEDHIRGGILVYKAETSVYLFELINTRHDGVGSVREHLLKLVNLFNKLNAMDIGITDQFLVNLALYSLSNNYEHIKISYNTQKESWTLNELIKKVKTEVVNLVHMKGKGKMITNYKNPNYKRIKQTPHKPNSIFPPKKPFKPFNVSVKNDGPSIAGLKPNKFHFKKCHQCHSIEHLRKDCPAFKFCSHYKLFAGISKHKGDK